MARSCFVEPKTARFDVMGGAHWVELKERLTYYEQERLENAALVTEFEQESGALDFTMDLPAMSLLRLETWIVEWSFTNAAGDRVAVSRDAIMALDPRLGAEIEELVRGQAELVAAEADDEDADKAIERHRQAIAALEMRKNEQNESGTGAAKK